MKIPGHAAGGILTRPHLGLVAEAGPEAIIPLSARTRKRALDLWYRTGQLLGTLPEPRVVEMMARVRAIVEKVPALEAKAPMFRTPDVVARVNSLVKKASAPRAPFSQTKEMYAAGGFTAPVARDWGHLEPVYATGSALGAVVMSDLGSVLTQLKDALGFQQTGGEIRITYSPTYKIYGGADVEREVRRAAKAAEEDFAKRFEAYLHQEKRLSYK